MAAQSGRLTRGDPAPPDLVLLPLVANLASRLCDEAKNGQILIDINVFNAVETRADAEFTEELILKGFSRPVKAFNVRNQGRSPGSAGWQ